MLLGIQEHEWIVARVLLHRENNEDILLESSMETTTLPSSLETLLQSSDRPVLVDFWAEWCGPCRALAPVLQDIAKAFRGKLYVVKVNIDEKPQIAAHYQVHSIPTLILFKNGKILWRTAGALPYSAFQAEIQRHLPI